MINNNYSSPKNNFLTNSCKKLHWTCRHADLISENSYDCFNVLLNCSETYELSVNYCWNWGKILCTDIRTMKEILSVQNNSSRSYLGGTTIRPYKRQLSRITLGMYPQPYVLT